MVSQVGGAILWFNCDKWVGAQFINEKAKIMWKYNKATATELKIAHIQVNKPVRSAESKPV